MPGERCEDASAALDAEVHPATCVGVPEQAEPGGRRRGSGERLMYLNAYALVANQVSSAGLGFLYWLLAARLYPVETVGAASATISTLMLVSGLALFSLKSGMTRFIPRAGRRVRTLILSAYSATILGSVVLGLAAVALADVLGFRGKLAGSGFSPALAVSATVLWTVFSLQDGVLIGLRRGVWVFVENFTYNLSKILLLVAGATLLGGAGIVASWFLPTPLLIAFVTVLVFARLAAPSRAAGTAEHHDPITLREVVTSVSGEHLGSLATEVAVRLLPLLVVASLGLAANALFYQAWLITNALCLVGSSMTNSFAAEAAADRRAIRAKSRAILRHMAAFLLPAVAVVGLAAPWLLALFGPKYVEAAPVLRWLALGAVPSIFANWYTSYCMVLGRIRRAVALQLLGAVLLVAASYLLLPAFGVAAVGVAWLISQGVVAAIAAVDAVPALLSAPTAAPGREQLLSPLLRRSDWRFLLDRPAITRAAVLSESALADSIRAVADEVVSADEAATSSCDVLVAAGASAPALARAADVLRPGGWCCLESSGMRGARSLERRLVRAGFEDVTVCWPAPRADHPRLWLTLLPTTAADRADVRRLLAQRVSSAAGARLVSLAAGFALASGRVPFPLVAVGRKPGGTGEAPFPAAFTSEVALRAGLAEAPSAPVMLSGGAHFENKLIWPLFDRGGERPRWFAKAARHPAGEEGLRREHEMLAILDERPRGWGFEVPRPVLWSEDRGTPVLVETTVEGEPLSSVAARMPFAAIAERLATPLTALADGRTSEPDPAWRDRLLEPALERLRGQLSGLPEASLVGTLRDALAALDSPALVVAHNDCAAWNVLVDGDSLGLIDWESGEARGLPLTDAVYALATVAFCLDGTIGTPDALRSYRRLLDPADERGRAFSRTLSSLAEACGVREQDVARLRLATWLLHTANDLHNLIVDETPRERLLARSATWPILRAELDLLTAEDGSR